MDLPHAHRRYLPPGAAPRETLATKLVVAAFFVAFILVFVVPTVLRWHA